MTQRTRAGIIGAGSMARHHIKAMLQLETDIIAVCEPSANEYDKTCQIFIDCEIEPPPNEPDFPQFIQTYADGLDAVFIITPHALHHDQTKACLEAGLDVLLEKPMVMNATEAKSLIDMRDHTGKLLVVAFQGGLSPQVRKAVQILRNGELGELLNISGTVWQNWDAVSANTWRQKPELSGGGFLFDTGAHVLNTISDLAGEDFAEVAAWLDNRGRDVDILGAVMGRLQSGGLVTINACGSTIPSCASEIKVFCTEGIIRTGMWGERLLIQRPGDLEFLDVEVTVSLGAWEQFLKVRRGEFVNPNPPEVGLRMAKLWDAIRESASQNGIPIQCT